MKTKSNMNKISTFHSILIIAGLLAYSGCANKAPTKLDSNANFTRGMELMSMGGEANLREAIDVFNSCVDAAPEHAACYAGLARAYTNIGGNYNIMPPEKSWPPARKAAEKAVALDDALPEAHLALAEVIAGQDWDWAAAERHFQSALALDPNHIETLISHSGFLFDIGRHDKSAAALAKLRELDPQYSDPWLEHLLTGNSKAARQAFSDQIASDPENPYVYWASANFHFREGEYEQAAEDLLKQLPLMKRGTLSMK